MTFSSENGAGSHIDLTFLLKISDGQREIMEEMIDVLLAQVDEAARQMATAFEPSNPALLERLAHRTAGACGSYGLKGIAAHLRLVEQCVREGDLQAAAGHFKRFAKEMSEFREEFAKWRGPSAGSSPPA